MARTRRAAGGRPVVAVTGAGGGLGLAVLQRLATREDLGGVIGVDMVRARVERTQWRAVDVRDPLLASRLTGVQAVVHLATSYDVHQPADERRVLNVRGTEAVVDAARKAGVAAVVLVTSVEVYGARADNSVPLPDDAPVRALPGEDLVGDHVEVERIAAGARDLAVAVVRPAALVAGADGPAYGGSLLRQLSAPRLLSARGTEPLWQLCHVEDLVAAIEVTVVAGLTGPLPVACDGWLAQSAVERIVGKRRVELPVAVALETAERLHRLGLSSGSPRDLDHLLGPVVVASERLRAAGWTPRWTNEESLRAHLAQAARSDGRAGAYTAAGATVALLGTAALVRRARRRRRGL